MFSVLFDIQQDYGKKQQLLAEFLLHLVEACNMG